MISFDEMLEAVSRPVEPEGISPYLNKIHCGDCLETMNQMPAGHIDLVVTSPPYNLRNSTGNGMKNPMGGKWEQSRLAKEGGYTDTDDCMPHSEYIEWQRACLNSMFRLLSDKGAIFYNHKWRVQNGLLQDRSDILDGFPVRQIIIWQRAGGINFNKGYFLPTYEVLYLICKPDFHLAPKKNALTDIWQIPQTMDNPHPAPFPVELALRCIDATEAETVLDPFIGSGSTAIAAEACGRAWIGIDVSEEHCELANERILTNRGLFKPKHD
jgi:modification methylase